MGKIIRKSGNIIRILLKESYRWLTAADGKEGFELAKKYLPDVIVTDIMMPIMDGLELCKAVKRATIATSHIPSYF